MMVAYVDPGLGALIWQSIVAAFVGVLFYITKTRRWIVNLYRKIVGRRPANDVRTYVPAETPAAKVEAEPEAR
jgi:hypothetical protein